MHWSQEEARDITKHGSSAKRSCRLSCRLQQLVSDELTGGWDWVGPGRGGSGWQGPSTSRPLARVLHTGSALEMGYKDWPLRCESCNIRRSDTQTATESENLPEREACVSPGPLHSPCQPSALLSAREAASRHGMGGCQRQTRLYSSRQVTLT